MFERFIRRLAVTIGGLVLLGVTHPSWAQATRSTPCSAATAWNSVCITWDAVTTASDGTPLPATATVTYRIEQRQGATGTWTGTAVNIAGTKYQVDNLTAGVWYFRAYAAVDTTFSTPSNIASRTVSTGVPSAPVITIAVVIGMDHAPVYSIVSGKRGEEVIGFVPVGTECEGKVVFRFRDKSYRRVSCESVKTWNVQCRNPAAPCA